MSQSDIWVWTWANELFYKYSKDWILYKFEKLKLIELKKEWNVFVDWENFFNVKGDLCDENWKNEELFRNNIDEYFENISFKKKENKYIFTLDFWEWSPTILEVY